MNTGTAALLAGCGFPQRWAGAGRCVLLQTHFGDGQGVLAAWHAWRSAAGASSTLGADGADGPDGPDGGDGARQLVFASIVAPAQVPDVPRALLAAHRDAPSAALAQHVCARWPPATPDLHVLELEPGVRLLLALGRRPWLRLLRLRADLVLFDPREPPPGMAGTTGAAWDAHALKALGRLASPHALWPGQPGGLPPAGAAQGPKRAAQVREVASPHSASPAPAPVTALSAPTAGSADSAEAAARAHPAPRRRHAVVIGAGIAGACAAKALARAGWDCTVLDARHQPAQGASGNAAGLFHGTVHPGDGLHARFTRACALYTAQVVRAMLHAGVPGSAAGLLRAHAQPQAGLHDGSPWPDSWVQHLDAAGVQQHVPGLRADSAWFFPGGGWVAAADAVRWLLQAPGIRFQGGAPVHTLQRATAGWHLLDAAGRPVAHADAVVLATAGQWPLVRSPATAGIAQALPLPQPRYSRGQVTWFDSPAHLRHPVAGHGYALTQASGQLLCGASSQPGEHPGHDAGSDTTADAQPRDSDHQFNLQRLAALTGIAPAPGAALHGRVGWRHLTDDRLPLVGAVPGALQAQAPQLERLRDVAREPDLWMLAGLGGRGFTWAPLLGEVVAARAGAGPRPREAALLDAADPARHLLRQARRQAAG